MLDELGREDTNKIWIGWFVFGFVTFVAYTSKFAAEAQVYCQYIDGGNNDKQCQGYSAAAFFVLLAALAGIVGLVVACKEMANMTHTMFMAMFFLFFLGYACYSGGQSAFYCEEADDNSGGHYVSIELARTNDNPLLEFRNAHIVFWFLQDDLCDGYAVSTFFAICGFVITAVGTYFAYQGGDEVAHEQMDDQPYPNEGGMPPTTVGHTIDDDYNKA